MKKIAFFAEGQTEAVFVEQFLNEYIGDYNLDLQTSRFVSRNLIRKVIERKNPYAVCEVQIFNAGGDSAVQSRIRERAESMIKNNGYDYIIGLRDLYPKERKQKKEIIEAFEKLFKKRDFYDRIKLVLAIMEIEAWFLMDYKMFCKIDSLLTHNFIKKELGYDLINDNPESYTHPTKIIDKIFHLCGKSYEKHKDDSYKIAYNLDYADLCCNKEYRNKVESWRYFMDCINLVFE
ncbi:MAG: DUF4276 family protein [Nitrospirae bacterium]|nr:DUF4276 family protein [Nitrospirota bacterium]